MGMVALYHFEICSKSPKRFTTGWSLAPSLSSRLQLKHRLAPPGFYLSQPPGLRSNLRNDGENSEFRYRIGCSFSPLGSNCPDVTAAAVGEVKDIPGMRIADITLAVFTFCNSLRFLAYLPRIARAVRIKVVRKPSRLGPGACFSPRMRRQWPMRP